MSVARLLAADRVLRNVEARSKKHALEILSELLAAALEETSAAAIFHNLVERERLGSTALGAGVALPHGRVDGLDESVGAIVKLSEGIDFDSPDGQPVQLIFGLLVPQECAADHLQDLSQIASLLSDEAFRERIVQTGNNHELYELFAAVPVANDGAGNDGAGNDGAGNDDTRDAADRPDDGPDESSAASERP